MRPFGLLLAACLCTILLYDQLAGRFPATVLAASSAPTSAAQTSARPETRLEKLQHYLVASQLLEMERSKLLNLSDRQRVYDHFLIESFVGRLNKELKQTWYRMEDSTLYDYWREKLPADKANAMIDEEEKNKKLIEKQLESFKRAVADHGSTEGKEFSKKFDELPWSKALRTGNELVGILTHERDLALAALKQD